MAVLIGAGSFGEIAQGLNDADLGDGPDGPSTPGAGGVALPTRSIELTGVDGTVWPLDCGGPVVAGTSPAVWGTAPVSVAAEERIGAPGGFVTGARHTARDLVIPLDLRPSDESLEELIARLARAVDGVRGDCTLTVERPDGTRRRITARYLQGLELITIPRRSARRTTAALSMRAHWPYWSSETPEVVVVSPPQSIWDSDEPTDFDDGEVGFNSLVPFDGAVVGASVFDAGAVGFDDAVAFDGEASEAIVVTLVNSGDVDAWPTWDVVGECGIVSATNLTTGKSWTLPGGLGAGDRLRVTTRPGEAAVRINDTLALSDLADGAALWSLPPGESVVVLQFVDGLEGSSFEGFWSPEYLTC